MAYFTAVLARTASGWSPREVDLDEPESLHELGDVLRGAAADEETVLLLVEHEDEWFAVVRVDGDEDPRVFLSDVEGAAHSPYAMALAAEVEPVDVPDDAPLVPAAGGDPDVLADLGTPAEELLDLCGEEGVLPTDAVDTIAAAAGFADVLDALR
jgi:putative tRNA adenosine deaminase-associated protein